MTDKTAMAFHTFLFYHFSFNLFYRDGFSSLAFLTVSLQIPVWNPFQNNKKANFIPVSLHSL